MHHLLLISKRLLSNVKKQSTFRFVQAQFLISQILQDIRSYFTVRSVCRAINGDNELGNACQAEALGLRPI